MNECLSLSLNPAIRVAERAKKRFNKPPVITGRASVTMTVFKPIAPLRAVGAA